MPNGQMPLVNLKDIAGLSAPLVKLIETISAGGGRISDGINRLANAYFLAQREAKNEAERILLIEGAKTQTVIARAKDLASLSGSTGPLLQIIDIAGQEVTAHLSEVSNETRTLHARSLSYISHQSLWQQFNREAVLNSAAAALEQETEIDPTPVNPDITSRILGIAQDVSNEEMQTIWGRILAGEIKKPGSYSLRTLDVLRNLSQDEAKLFNEATGYILVNKLNGITTAFLYKGNSSSANIKTHFSYSKILKLMDAGLVQSTYSDAFRIEYEDEEEQKFLLKSGQYALLCSVNPGSLGNIRFNKYTLTHAASELYNLISSKVPMDYLKAIKEDIEEMDCQVDIKLFSSWTESDMLYEDVPQD